MLWLNIKSSPVFAFSLTSGTVKLRLVDSVWDSHLAKRLWKLVWRLRASLHTCSERQTRGRGGINHLRHKDNTIWRPHNLLWSHYRFLDSCFNCAECWLCHTIRNKVCKVETGIGEEGVGSLPSFQASQSKRSETIIISLFTMCISNKGKPKHPTVEISLLCVCVVRWHTVWGWDYKQWDILLHLDESLNSCHICGWWIHTKYIWITPFSNGLNLSTMDHLLNIYQ